MSAGFSGRRRVVRVRREFGGLCEGVRKSVYKVWYAFMRHYLAKERRRGRQVCVRLTEAEYERLHAMMEWYGAVSASDFVRRIVLGKVSRLGRESRNGTDPATSRE